MHRRLSLGTGMTEGDGLLNLMVSLSPPRTSLWLPSSSASARSRARFPNDLCRRKREPKGPSLPPFLASFGPSSSSVRPGVRKNSRSSAKTELALSLQIRPTSLVLNPGEEERGCGAGSVQDGGGGRR